MTLTLITDHDEIEARTAWAMMALPGDKVAHHLTQALGHTEALDLVRRSTPVLPRTPGMTPSAAHTRWLPGGFPAITHGLSFALEQTRKLALQMVDPSSVPGLDDLGDRLPHAIWVRGDLAALTATDRITIIGSRACTMDGEMISADLARGLASSGISVHSTASYGVDGSAHRGALEVGGSTVAWMASGLERYYPAGHHELITQIGQTSHCAVASIMPPGSSPIKSRILQRSRGVAAATPATVAVEMSRMSGAARVVHNAVALGRAIGAVPGPITRPQSAGCHELIRAAGASLITSAADARELLEI